MSAALHPARSSEFLSRLHDGEVPDAERAAFDAHARTCAECRDAVAAFDRALSAYRSAEPIPAAADLSARILRKIRAQSPSRRPFGVVYGIDLRWAGASVAAVLALLVAVPVLLRSRAASRPVPTDALSARILVSEPDAKPDAAPPEPAASASPAEAPAPAPRPAVPAQAAAREKREFAASAPPPPPAARPRAPAPEAGASAAPAAAAENKDVAAQLVVSGEAPVVETQGAASDAAPARRGLASEMRAKAAGSPAVHVSVRAGDQGGPAPAVVATPREEELSVLRGRQLLVVVDASGRVVALEPLSADKTGSAKRAAKEASDAEALQILRGLRFEPGPATRRLVVQVE